MMTDRIAALDQYVEQHVQQSMQDLVRLCNQPSISSQGLGMQECAALAAELLRSRGIAAQVMETAGYPVVYGEYGTGEKKALWKAKRLRFAGKPINTREDEKHLP